MKNNPRVSVIMPNYNCEKYIAEAIESILNQTFTDFEFIIIDDCSADNSWEIIQEYAKRDKRIVALRNDKNLKICKTLNRGIDIAQGEYIARMDADDISVRERLHVQVDFLDTHEDVGIVGGTMEIMNEQGEVYGKRQYNLTDEEIRKKIFRYSPFCHPAIMMRKSVLVKSGGYDPGLVYAEDYDLYFRIGMYARFANLNDKILKYRMYLGNSTTKKLREMEKKTLEIRKKAVQEYGYVMSYGDKIYYQLQYITMYLLPGKIKIWLFNLLRNR